MKARSVQAPAIWGRSRSRSRLQTLSPGLVELFHTCWMHSALKEATRIPLSRLDEGHYVRPLKLCIDRRCAPGLERLFSLGS